MRIFINPFIIFCLFATCLYSCKKNKAGDVEKPVEYPGVFNENVKIIDTAVFILNNDTTLLNEGIYEYQYNGAKPDFNTGDILFGTSGIGYLRRVVTVESGAGSVRLQTDECSLEELFNDTELAYSVNMDNMIDADLVPYNAFMEDAEATDGQLRSVQTSSNSTLEASSINLAGIRLFKSGEVEVAIKNGSIALTGDWNFDYGLTKGKLDKVNISCDNFGFAADFLLNVKVANTISLPQREGSIKKIYKRIGVPIPFTPLTVPTLVIVDFRYEISGDIRAAANRDFAFKFQNNIDFGISYSGGALVPAYSGNSSGSVTPHDRTVNLDGEVKFSVTPKIEFLMLGRVGPYASLGLLNRIAGSVTTQEHSFWDFYAGTWLRSTVGVQAKSLSKTLAETSKSWDTDTIFYATPFQLSRASGDNQVGKPDEYLSKPLTVKVVDSEGESQSNVTVLFSVTKGSGSVDQQSAVTDDEGKASVRFKLGNNPVEIQSVTAEIRKSDGSVPKNGQVEFAAVIGHADDSLEYYSKYYIPGMWRSTVVSTDPDYPGEYVSRLELYNDAVFYQEENDQWRRFRGTGKVKCITVNDGHLHCEGDEDDNFPYEYHEVRWTLVYAYERYNLHIEYKQRNGLFQGVGGVVTSSDLSFVYESYDYKNVTTYRKEDVD